MFSAVRKLPTLVFVLAAAAACSQGTSGNGGKLGDSGVTPCMQDSDCSNDGSSVCRAGSCVENNCTTDADCPSGQQCSQLSSECVATDGGSDGGGGCTTKADCDFGQACDNGTCGMVPATCGEDSQCARGQICNFDQMCVAGCDTDTDCESPQTCNMTAFTCEGGTDGGTVSDAGTSDAGTSDAGTGGCASDADCSGTPSTPACDTSISECVQCTSTDMGACAAGDTCVTDTCTGGTVCSLCTCDNSTCPTDSSGDCNDGSNCEGSSGGTCTTNSDCGTNETCVDVLITSACAANCPSSEANDTCGGGDGICCSYSGSSTGYVCSTLAPLFGSCNFD